MKKTTKNNWVLGIRPADIVIGSSVGESYSLKARVSSVEHLGESSVVTVDVDGQQMLIEVPGLSSEKKVARYRFILEKKRLIFLML